MRWPFDCVLSAALIVDKSVTSYQGNRLCDGVLGRDSQVVVNIDKFVFILLREQATMHW